MLRQQFIDYAKFLDEGCNLLGESYIQSRTDEYISKLSNKKLDNSTLTEDCLHPFHAVKKNKITELCSCSVCGKEWY